MGPDSRHLGQGLWLQDEMQTGPGGTSVPRHYLTDPDVGQCSTETAQEYASTQRQVSITRQEEECSMAYDEVHGTTQEELGDGINETKCTTSGRQEYINKPEKECGTTQELRVPGQGRLQALH